MWLSFLYNEREPTLAYTASQDLATVQAQSSKTRRSKLRDGLFRPNDNRSAVPSRFYTPGCYQLMTRRHRMGWMEPGRWLSLVGGCRRVRRDRSVGCLVVVVTDPASNTSNPRQALFLERLDC